MCLVIGGSTEKFIDNLDPLTEINSTESAMSNNGHDAEVRQLVRLIFLAVLEGLFLTVLVLRHWIISKLNIDPFPFGDWLFRYFFFTSEFLFAIGTLEAIFKLLFISNRTNTGKRFPRHLPWWCGR